LSFRDSVTYHADVTSTETDADIAEYALVNKRRVIQFITLIIQLCLQHDEADIAEYALVNKRRVIQFITLIIQHCLQHDEADIAEYALVNKRRVIQFVWQWCSTIGDAFWEDKTTQAFLGVRYDTIRYEMLV